MTFNFPLTQINVEQLESLTADGVREGRQLEYKEVLRGNSDDEKREFLSDVTSFANAAGGDIIFGIRERREAGITTAEIEAVVGLPGLNLDAERLRLEALIRDGVAPRMLPVSFHEIRRDPEPSCLLLRVSRSAAGLHMVMFRNLSPFFARTSAGKYQLDVHEIRAGFVAAETVFERLRRFRQERVARILADEAPISISDEPKMILHALPVNALDEVWVRVLTMTEHNVAFAIPLIGGSPDTWHFNLDGFVAHTLRNDLASRSYTQ